MFALDLLVKLLPLYLLAGLGFVGGRWVELKSQEIGRAVLFFISPAVIFKGFYQADLSSAQAALPVGVFAVACTLGLLATVAGRRLWRDGTERIVAFSAGTGNTGFFGIPACLALVGPESFPYVVMFSFGAIAYEVSLGFYLVARTRATVREAVRRALAYPGLHACWIGLALNLSGLRLPEVMAVTVDFLSGAYVPLGMMIVGLGLAGLQDRRGLDPVFGAFAFGFKFLAWPAFAFGFVALDVAWLGLFDTTARQVILVQGLVPMAAVTVVHAAIQQVHPEKASVAVAASTLFALFYLPFALTLMNALLGH